jgi:hypothetical protein
MCTRIIRVYGCGHHTDHDIAPCASSKTRGYLCSASAMKSKSIKHDQKCDQCEG